MQFKPFQESLQAAQPPQGLSLALQALWYEGKGDWERAHELADQVHTPENNWVHAYLHRKEGDQWNADYWYRKAGQPSPQVSLSEEWRQIVLALL